MLRNPYDYYITDEDYQEAAKRGISRKTLEVRIRRYGWPKHKAITTPVQKRTKYPKEILELINRNQIPMKTFTSRISRGWTLERASQEPVNSKAEIIQKIASKNRKLPSELVKLALKNGIKLDTFRYRLKRGWDAYTAATMPTYSKEDACAIARKKSSFGLGNEMFWNSLKAKSLNKKASTNGGAQCSNQKDGTSYR
ncbi:hypothetical protein [Lysinibacillus sp. NPDC047702]|uniref:hypothetical protein n=1 Tax=unclassified Lysinibacillus TaxID=2636778 RepID=UPI003D01D589